MLFEAARHMFDDEEVVLLKAWAMKIARDCGMKKAIVALRAGLP